MVPERDSILEEGSVQSSRRGSRVGTEIRMETGELLQGPVQTRRVERPLSRTSPRQAAEDIGSVLCVGTGGLDGLEWVDPK
ncbi:hypothetical protein chiPu_0030544 [Chiloscyllium punctatum]|uniref:Uncharacterized protein n=1 Tax=Chiloscyllium punctatum TaxID=137246 RepID=A0A401TU87_CHIPU|nr:hypothetical protein [Chiloscyllium punctatum]